MSEAPPSTPPSGPEQGAALVREAERVFFEVMALSPADREAALARASAVDAALGLEVRALVRSAQSMGDFLEGPALGVSAQQLADEQRDPHRDPLVGQTLGSFRVERRIASGGMGTVYLASRSDGQFERKAAIKLVKRGMDSDEVLRRFASERQTLAALDHPSIARLLDASATPDGRPYLVMEYVEGKPIDQYCDEKGLSVAARLRLFQQVCDAVHAAHRALVIHRDLKPANILVTDKGEVKLVDFGIAKLLSPTTSGAGATTDHERRLTPEYASPEQVDGASITTASDVYSLGVVLYELLAGQRPYHFATRTREEVRRVVCTLVPAPPSEAVSHRTDRVKTSSRATPALASAGATGTDPEATRTAPAPPRTRAVTPTRLRAQLRGDLDNIALVALRKEPSRRYASAQALGEDVGRYLAGLPVRARKDTTWYRAGKFVRRHALGVTLACGAVATLAALSILLHRQGVDLRRQRDELFVNAQRLSEQRRFLVDVLEGAGTSNFGPDARMGAVLAAADQRLQDAPPTDPLTLAASRQAVGRAMMSVGALDRARVLLEGAAEGYAHLPEDSEARLDITKDLGELLFHEGKAGEAEAVFRDVLTRERARAGGAPTPRVGALLNDLGASLRVQGKSDEALATQREALAVRTRAFGTDSLEAAESEHNLGAAHLSRGEARDAREHLARALAIRTQRLREDHPLVVSTLMNLGLARVRSGEAPQGERDLAQAAELWQRAFGPDHPGAALAWTALGQARRTLGAHEASLEAFARARAWQDAHAQGQSPGAAATKAQVALTLLSRGAPADRTLAVTELREAVPLLAPAASRYRALLDELRIALEALASDATHQADARALADMLPR